MTWLWDLLISLLSGGFAGLGLGGGWLLIAYLIGFGRASQPQARAIVLLLFIPAAAISLIGQAKSGLVNFRELWFPALLGVGAVFLGLWVSGFLSEQLLRWIMVALLGAVGIGEVAGGLKMK